MFLVIVFISLEQLFDLNSSLAKFQSAEIKQKQSFMTGELWSACVILLFWIKSEVAAGEDT